MISPEVLAFKLATARLSAMPAIIREMVEPARHIDSLRISTVNGMPGTTPGPAAETEKGPVGQIFDSIASMAVQMPVLKALGREVGMNFDQGIDGILSQTPTVPDAPAAGSAATPAKRGA